VRESKGVHILELKQWHRNVNIRAGGLELKELVEQKHGLQRWKPAGQGRFPFASAEIQKSMLPCLEIDRRNAAVAAFSRKQSLGEIVKDSRELFRANVFQKACCLFRQHMIKRGRRVPGR
jgi:hypothetical protein